MLQHSIPGYEIRQALSATAALAVAYFWRPDLNIVDLRLPDLDREELLRLIRRDPSLGQTPVLIISALVRLLESVEGPNAFHGTPAFGKPFSIPRLREHVAERLVGSESQPLWS